MLMLEHDSAPLVAPSPFSGWKRSTWILWLCLSVLLNVDKGIFPLALQGTDFASMAWQSSIPYALGAAAALCIAGAMFQARSAKSVVAGCLLIDALAFFILSTNPHPRVYSQLRVCNGFVAVVVLLYIPLWVEEFSPPSSQSKWMIIFAFIGPAFGVLAGFMASIVQPEAQTALLILAACLALCAVKVSVSSAVMLHVPTLEKQCFVIPRLDSWSSPAVQIRQWWDEEPHTSKTVSVLLGLVHVAGAPLLFFSPKVFGADLFTCLAIALCPFIGTALGAYLCKSHGGYKPGHAHRALKTLWGILGASMCSSVLLFMSTYLGMQPIALGCLLLCLGAALPPAAGVLMTGCPSYHRPASCFLSAFLYQIFGYAVSTGVFPLVASCFNDAQGESALVAQVFVTLTASVILGAYCYARFPKVVLPLGLSGIDVQKEEIECEVSRKRLIVSL